ncbi:DUF4350 domain-containing protein [Aquimarina sediminis]|uniref:DUF4350 domain-containing protein n=1 Tax=Aquimarina sediminis TaxID=2070536 RepID=UPI000FFE48A4|nr:DUF4350 domain-containing protein [Aquimarina sediminis]
MKIYQLFIVSLLFANTLFSQQLADTLYNPKITSKAYPKSSGTLVHIDQGHNNFHTKDNRFLPFARLLSQDGYRIAGYEGKFEESKLKDLKILVISNALSQNSRPPFVAPTETAFSTQEIENLRQWVKKGGSLFLIADHMPFAGAAANLARVFGFEFYDGFVFDANDKGIFDFTRENKMLPNSKIINGRNKSESVNSVRTFTGQGFKIPKEASSILSFKKEFNVFVTDTMWVFNENTPMFSAENLSQGAVREYGKGKVAVFGEAAMFTAQIAGRDRIKVGMNTKEASENYQLLLNLIHWLDNLY